MTRELKNLNEQLKAIQKELGEIEDGRDETTSLNKAITKAKMPKDVEKKCLQELKKLKKGSKEFLKGYDEEKSKMSIQRFKGLGEMNPDELWETTLNPEKRTLLQVKYSNNTKAKSKKDQDLSQILMGDEVAPRKDFIISRALDVSNLDI